MSAGRRNWRFHFVDVFAVEPLTGNSLTVVEDAADLTVDQLQRIAREFNQSETTFLLPPTRPDADWRLRSCTTPMCSSAGLAAGAPRSSPACVQRSRRNRTHWSRPRQKWPVLTIADSRAFPLQ